MRYSTHNLFRFAVIAFAGVLGLILAHAAQAQPVASTLAATGVTATNATLNGTVNPGGLPTTAYFQYGPDTNYGNIGDFRALPATNLVLTMPGLAVDTIIGAAGSRWIESDAPSTNWSGIASSADGARLAATVNRGGIYISTNSGLTWTESSAPSTYWWSIASSADGTRLVAGVEGGGIYTSTNSGGTWIESSGPTEYFLVGATRLLPQVRFRSRSR
jgi:hypothetical protein